jgi:sortase (surface protein transpeptidase)
VAAALLTITLASCGSPPDSIFPATGRVPSSPTQSSPSSQPGLPRSEPTTLDIPAIAVHSELVALGLNPDQTVRVPPVSTPMQAGWYEHGPTPGEIGPAVILGHVDGTNQPGVFYRLHELAAGAEVRVMRKDGSTAVFEVRRVEQVAKDAFPTGAVYADTTDAELRLITCGGAFNRTTGHYLDNLIIYATMRN